MHVVYSRLIHFMHKMILQPLFRLITRKQILLNNKTRPSPKTYWARVTSALNIKIRRFIQINFTQLLSVYFLLPNYSGMILPVSNDIYPLTLFTALLYKICLYHYVLSTSLFWLPNPPHNLQT